MLAIAFVVALCVIAPSYARKENPIFELTDQDFDNFLKDKEVMLVDFYAPWCSDCDNLRPKYEKAARDLAKEHKFVMAKMDCFGAGRATCYYRFGIHQWPTLKLFRYGQPWGDYTGPQDTASLESYIHDQLGDGKKRLDDSRGDNGLWNQNGQNLYNNAIQNNGWTFTQVSGTAGRKK